MPSAGGRLLPYRLSGRVVWPLPAHLYNVLLQMKDSHLWRNPFNFFEEGWCGLGRNRRKLETLVFFLEGEVATPHMRNLRLSLSSFQWERAWDWDLVIRIQRSLSVYQIIHKTRNGASSSWKSLLGRSFFIFCFGWLFLLLATPLGGNKQYRDRKLMLNISNLCLKYNSKSFPSIPRSQLSLQKKPPLKVYCGLFQKHHMHLPSDTDSIAF